MKLLPKVIVVLLVLFGLCIPLHGQVAARQPEATSTISSLLVTAQAARDHIRFTALTVGSRMRLEILSQTGDTLYDSSFQPGNLIEWPLADQQGSRLPDGVYGCIVTVEELSGRVTYRRGLFRLADGKVSFDVPDPSRLMTAAIDEGGESISILRTDDRFPFTFVGHDGTDARIESTAGGLILHAGRFYAGESGQSPHMRLTLDGNLGIGVREPAARLDVGGLIRTSEGIMYPDGTIQRTAGRPGLVALGGTEFTMSPEGKLVASVGERFGSRPTNNLPGAAGQVAHVLARGGTGGPFYGNESGSNTWYGDFAGASLTSGPYNSFFGFEAGYSNTTGANNSFFGQSAGYSNITGGDNSFFGESAGYSNTTGSNNSFFGGYAGFYNTTGVNNSFFGNNTGGSNTTGCYNSFFGNWAGAFNTTGVNNSFFGKSAGENNTTGANNSFFGLQAGYSNTTGGDNSFFGDGAGYYNTTGYYNSFFGLQAGYSNTTGGDNSFFGRLAGKNNTTAHSNSFFGSEAGYYNTAGDDNSFFGLFAGHSNTTGDSNSFFGLQAGYSNTTGGSNSFFGQAAGYANTTGNSNSFVGKDAGYYNTTGVDNSFFGNEAGYSNSTGSNNSFVGRGAGASNTAGVNNSFFGRIAGFSNTTGGSNSFFGRVAGYSNTTGSSNSFFGNDAGYSNTTAGDNSFFGAFAGYNNTTGINDSFFGKEAGYSNTTGYSNLFSGLQAGYANSEGYSNTFLGTLAGFSNTTESNNTLIGANSDVAAGITNATAIGARAKVTQSNSLVLGGVKGVNTVNAETNVGIGVTNPDRQLTVEGTQAIGRFRRYYGTADPFTATFAPAFLFERARPTQAAPTDILAGDYLGKVQFRGRVGGSYPEYGAIAFIASDTAQNGRFAFLDRDIATERMSILNTGNVGIGTTAPTERLHVVGNIRVTGTITYGAPDTDLPDYVFDPNYKLMPIDDLERFIAQEKHLPNVPAAAEIREKGLNLGEFQMRLLEKVEELTLYAVQQERTIREQKTTIDSKEARISSLEARLAAIEQMLLRQQK